VADVTVNDLMIVVHDGEKPHVIYKDGEVLIHFGEAYISLPADYANQWATELLAAIRDDDEPLVGVLQRENDDLSAALRMVGRIAASTVTIRPLDEAASRNSP
jgi:hypothetical protein